MKLKQKMLLFIGVPVLLTIVVLSFVSYRQSRQIILDETKELIKIEAQKYASDIETLIARKIGYMEILKQNIQNNLPSNEDLLSSLTYLTENTETANAFYIALKNGPLLSGNGWVPGPDFISSERPWYKNALGQKSVVISEPYVDAQTSETVITLSTEIIVNGNHVGVLAADMNLTELTEMVQTIKVKDSGSAFLVENSGLLVVHPKFETGVNILKADSGKWYEIASNGLEKKLQVMESTLEKVDYFYLSCDISNVNWTLMLGVPKKELFVSSNKLGLFMLILGISSMLAIGFIIYWIASSVSKPIVRLSQCIDGMVNYDFTLSENSPSVIYSKNKDEIGNISRSLIKVKNTMREFMLNANDVADRVSASSQQLSATSEQSAHSVEGISRIFEDISQGTISQAEDMQKGAECRN